jgi:hypothetical protein
MKFLNTVARLDWSGWGRGLLGAFVSGGAGAIGAASGVTAMDPSHDLAGWRLFGVMGIAFLSSGIISLAKYLQTHPVPDAAAEH